MTLGADFVRQTERFTMQLEQKMCNMFKGFNLWSEIFLSDDVLNTKK